jgi:hypothetical protein
MWRCFPLMAGVPALRFTAVQARAGMPAIMLAGACQSALN